MATPNEIIAGLSVFVRRGDGDLDTVDVSHDVICVLPSTPLSAEDVAELTEAGWHYSEEFKSWAMFT